MWCQEVEARGLGRKSHRGVGWMRLIEGSESVDRSPSAPAPLSPDTRSPKHQPAATPPPEPLPPGPETLTGQVAALRSRLQETDSDEVPEHELLDALRGLEDLTRAAAAATVRLSARFHAEQVAEQARRGVPVRRRGKAVADDLALTRKTSPYLATRELTGARALVSEMPGMLQALTNGDIDAGTARMVTEETVCLEPHHRARIDELLAPRVHGMSTKQLRAEVRALVQELDPQALVRRARKATKDRGVWVRPVPDVMALLSARLPAAAAIACHKALADYATALKASGDERSKSQIMADELFARLTGRSAAEGVDVEVQIVMTDASLFSGDPAAAILNDYGPVPAQSARDLLYPEEAADESTPDDSGQDGPPERTPTDRAPTGTPPRGSTPTGSTPGGTAPTGRAPASTTLTGTTPTGTAQPDTDADLCPDGPRCTKFSCNLLHGTPLPKAPPEPSHHAPSTTGDPPAGVSPAAGGSTPSTGNSTLERQAYRAAKVYLRRLYADPQTGHLTGRDTRRRRLPADLRATLISRDRYCRTPWCGAPVRHADHPVRWSEGGPTDLTSNQGLCEHCNLAREHERACHLAPTDYLPPPPVLPTLIPQPRAG